VGIDVGENQKKRKEMKREKETSIIPFSSTGS
jgi:hypothetical protein